MVAAQLRFALHHRENLLELLARDSPVGVGVKFLEGGPRHLISVRSRRF
jgi:hypothetical protein